MVIDTTRADELDWVQLRKDLGQDAPFETTYEKAKRKFGQSPMIPIGCLLTVAALTNGVYNFWQGRSLQSQYMMRARVAAQGITIVAVLVSLSTTLPEQK